jgi:hypothetical protein
VSCVYGGVPKKPERPTQIVGLNALQDDTGETARALQELCDIGVLKPLAGTNKRGRGYHREFDASPPHYGERTWALIASALRRLRIPSGDIKIIIDAFRSALGADDAPANPKWEKRLITTPVGRALMKHFEIILVFVAEDRSCTWQSLYSASSPPPLSKRGHVIPTPKGDRTVFFDENIKLELEPRIIIDRDAGYMLNLTKILEPLWSK